MQVFRPRPSPQEVDPALSKLTGTRPREQKANPSLLDEAVYFIQQYWEPLNLVDDDQPILRSEFFRQLLWALTECQIDGCIEEVVDAGTTEGLGDQKALPGLARSQEEVGLLLHEAR